jgi:hypothetical protein
MSYELLSGLNAPLKVSALVKLLFCPRQLVWDKARQINNNIRLFIFNIWLDLEN